MMHLLKKMLSIPLELPLTCTQRFTYLSALVAYMITGLIMALAPDLWNIVLRLDFGAGGRGFFILVALGLFDIGLCMIVLARNKGSQEPNAGPILGTVFNRLVLVNVYALKFYTEGILNARFAGMMSALDSTLAVIIYVIWSRENTDASLSKFFQDLWSTINPFSQRPPQYQSFLLLGYAQAALDFVAPSILLASGIAPSAVVGRHAEGLFRAFFVIRSIIAFFQVFAAGSQNDSYPIVSVFHRLACNIPVFLALCFSSQIPVGLGTILVIYDLMQIALTIFIANADHSKAK
ncbi:uncharacterized protein LOC114523130 [Dendronephthya gigantea]|uniref:uncharacterized protein LOC114523130 n=1 Tax=Dendronephthya gigantea TaxID=151771 RepID=UPI00106A5992|nr:uncharacterized protein LOC114523130 [Dendronephthya gigantea]